MTANEIVEHFLSRAAFVDRATTVDRVITGDGNAGVDACLVTWMAGYPALREAVRRGLRLLICHEPTFWNHRDTIADAEARAKQAYIERHELIVVRIHDSWDRWPEVGIPFAWAEFLGLGRHPVAISTCRYQHRYDIPPTPLDDFARRVADRCQALGERAVQVVGNNSEPVSRVGIGTGCACDIGVFRAMGCDCSIVCDDGSCYWEGIQRAADTGHQVIRVNHGTSEEPGMLSLSRYINASIDGLRAEHLPHGCGFRLVES